MRNQARKALRAKLTDAALPGCVSLRPGTDALGATRRDKNRLTLVLRQIIHSVFDLPPGELPQGRHLPSLLIVVAGQVCMLNDMSEGDEPAVWLRTHTIIHQGTTLERVAGKPVGALMAPWRELRRARPDLFTAGVLVGGLLYFWPGREGPRGGPPLSFGPRSGSPTASGYWQ